MFGLSLAALSLREAVQHILAMAHDRETGLVVTPNVDQIVKFERDAHMWRVYREAALALADGMPLVWFSRLVGDQVLPERVTGADLLPAICAEAARRDLSVYFFGGDPGVADAAAERLVDTFPGLKVAGTCCPPYGFENDAALSKEYARTINASGADILFLGVGAPKQEKWGHAHLTQLEVGPILCVGAAFAFAAGLVNRAPSWVQGAGLEWLWRLVKEPRRLWRRYLVDDVGFFWLAVREYLRLRQCGDTQRDRV